MPIPTGYIRESYFQSRLNPFYIVNCKAIFVVNNLIHLNKISSFIIIKMFILRTTLFLKMNGIRYTYLDLQIFNYIILYLCINNQLQLSTH